MGAPKGNKFAVGNEGGRPTLLKNAKHAKDLCDAYFEWIKGEAYEDINVLGDIVFKWKREPEPATITGLTLFLGFESRQSFYDNCEKENEISYTLKKYRTQVENSYEKKLSGTTPTGSIFALKNMGWKDRTEVAPVTPEGESYQIEKPYSRTELIELIKQANGKSSAD